MSSSVGGGIEPAGRRGAVRRASRPDRRVLLALLLALLSLGCGLGEAWAQACSGDAQCRDNGRTRTYCSGDTLVGVRSICSGTCRDMEVFRQACPGPCVGDRCIGGSQRSSPAQPPLGGSLVGGACARVCTCRGKQLTYGVGVATSADQCRTRTVDCKYGCTCAPEPRCLKKGEV